jgi:inward rectifier potassium channel
LKNDSCPTEIDRSVKFEREPGKTATRVRLGSYEFKKRGVSRFDVRDPYRLAVALTWPHFLTVLLALYLSVNLVFATLFCLVPGSLAHARPNSFSDALFFSIETLATVGYGEMYPATSFGRAVAAMEIVCGLGFTAIVTGLTFVRFSRPRAKLVFAANPVVATHNGKPTLMVRIGNAAPAVLADVAAKLNIFFIDTTAEGVPFRRAQELGLERAHIPIFTMFWTLMHVLDERSPLHGYDAARMIETDARVFITMEAHDPTLATTVHECRYYAPQEIRFGMRYADAVSTEQDGTRVADLRRTGALEPDAGDRQEGVWTEREEIE